MPYKKLTRRTHPPGRSLSHRKQPIWTTGVPMKRRVAYRIYNYFNLVSELHNRVDRFVSDHPQLFDQCSAAPNPTHAFRTLLCAHGVLTQRELKLLTRGPLYTKDQQRRSVQKVERDLYNPRKGFHLWTRYKVAPAYRRLRQQDAEYQEMQRRMAALQKSLEQVLAATSLEEIPEACLAVSLSSDKLASDSIPAEAKDGP